MSERLLYDKRTIRKEIFFLIIPIILENVFQMSAGIVSSAMIGRLSPVLISSQGICSRITGVLLSLFRGIGIGATVVTAKIHGGGNSSECKKTFEQTAFTGIIISFVFTGIILFYSEGFLSFFTSNKETLFQSGQYLKIVMLGSPFTFLMAAVTAAFQGQGNTKTPMYISIFVNIINIVLGYLLIYGKFGFPRLLLTGAAISLTISQIAGAILGLYLLYSSRIGLFGSYSNKEIFKINKNIMQEVYSVGIPAAFESMFWQLSAILMSKAILSYGEMTFSAYQLGLQAEFLTEMPAVGLGVAATALSANAIGRKDGVLLKAYSRELIVISTAMSLVTSLLIIFFPGAFMSFFTDNAEIKAIGIKYLVAMGFIQIPQNVSKVLNGVIRSSGYKRTPMYVSFLGIWVVRIPLSLFFTYILKLDIIFIWLSMVIDQIVRYITSIIIYKTKKPVSIQEA